MAKKKKKSRTYNKFWNGVVSCIRTNFARYHPKYEEILEASRIEKVKYKKDGEPHKTPDVWYRCSNCDELSKKENVEIDHTDPVIEIGKSSHDYTLDEILRRIDCDINNLKVLCSKCHKDKTSEERKLRQAKKGKK